MLKGKVTFLNFWGTWCPPCRAEIPHLIELHKQFKDRGFNIIGFALERQGDAVTNVKNYVTKSGINYRNFPSREYTDEFAKKFGQIQFVPTTFVIGRDGKVVETIVGGKDKAGFEEIIRKYIDVK
jgi:thiol-disulfide isomerase/thioredoxin